MTFDKEIALACMEVYTDEPDFVHGNIEVRIYRIGNAFCFVHRGTDSNYDALTDLRAIPWHVSELGCWCHSGFAKGVRGWWGNGGMFKKLLPHIKMAHDNGMDIVFSGHSKGGAEATLEAALCNKLGIPCRLITFGSPKVATKGLLAALRGVEAVRYVLGIDVVPRLPKGLWWCHVWRLKHLISEIEHDYHNHRIADYWKATP